MTKMFAIVINVLLLAALSSAHVCDFCDCQPSKFDTFSIICDGNLTENLQLTSSMMTHGVSATTLMVIKNYQVLTIEKNSFAQLNKLDTLMIQNCVHMYLASGAFANLHSLFITNIQDIVLEEMALMGARGIKNLVIKNSNIQKLHQYALFDVKDLIKFELNGVDIGKMYRNSCNITAQTVTIANSTVNYTETDAITLNADKVLIKKSNFNGMEFNSFNIISKYQIMVHGNEFKGFFELNITSPFVEMLDNRFEKFNSNAVRSVQMKRFYNNAIQNSDLSKLLQRADYRDFYDNAFQCVCGMNLLKATQNSQDYNILKKNFCIVNCTISLFDFEVESTPLCMKDGEVDVSFLCNRERYLQGSLDKPKMEDSHGNNTVEIKPRYLAFDNENGSDSFFSHSGGKMFGIDFAVMAVSVAFLKHFC